MESINHQYMQFGNQVVKRYVRTTTYPIGGKRYNPFADKPEVIDFLLATPADNFTYTPEVDPNGGGVVKTVVTQNKFDYDTEVVELYSDDEVKMFQRLNRALLEDGALIEYNDAAPIVELKNTLSTTDINKLVKLKTKTIFESKIAEITSVRTLKLIMAALEDTDAPMSYAKIVRERENELNKS